MKQLTAKYKKRESELPTTSQRVIDNLENNPDYPNAPEALGKLKKVLPEFQAARVNAQSRDKKMVSIKNDLKAILLGLLQELADFVTATSKGDRTLILGSGFDVIHAATRGSNQPPFVEILEVQLGQSGEATTRARNITGAKGYVHQYTKEPPGLYTEWIGEGSSSSDYTFQGLSSDKRYWFRVVVIGYNEQRAYSPVVSKVIQ